MCVVKISYFMSAFLVSRLMTIFMNATDLIIFAMSLFIISILMPITEHVIFHLLKLLLMQVVLIAFAALRMEFI
jgi:hypothetical protein